MWKVEETIAVVELEQGHNDPLSLTFGVKPAKPDRLMSRIVYDFTNNQ